MGAPWGKSSHRGADCEQGEYCALCGCLVDASTLIEAQVQGLYGQMICASHPWEAEARLAPSFQDLGGIGQVTQLNNDEAPHGAPDYTYSRVRTLPRGTYGPSILALFRPITELSLDVLSGETYDIAFVGFFDGDTIGSLPIGIGGTASGNLAAVANSQADPATLVSMSIYGNGYSVALLTALTRVTISGSVTLTASGTLCFEMTRNVGGPLLRVGATLQITRRAQAWP